MSLNLVMKACLTTSTAISEAITMSTSGNSTHKWSKNKHIKNWSVPIFSIILIRNVSSLPSNTKKTLSCSWEEECDFTSNYHTDKAAVWMSEMLCSLCSTALVTRVPWELLHVSQTDDEQEDVVGEPLFYVCGKQTNQSWINLLCTHCGWARFHKFTFY